MTAGRILKAVPLGVWLAAGAAGVVYILGRQALARLPNGGAAGLGETLGRGAAELVGGTVKGVAAGTGAVLGSVIKAPAEIADSAVRSATDGRGASLGSWLYDLTHDEYDPNAPKQSADEADWWANLNPWSK